MPILGSNAVEYIRNRKDCQNRGVCFSFWYKPDGVNLTEVEKNKAGTGHFSHGDRTTDLEQHLFDRQASTDPAF